MASKITIKRSTAALPPAGLSFGELAFVQGTGLTADQLYIGISGGSPIWIGAEIGTTGTWTDNAAKTSLATQYAIDQRISSQISGSNVITTAEDNSNATKYLVFTSGAGAGVTLGVDTAAGAISYNPSISQLTMAGDLNVNGGDIFTTQSTATVFNATATALSIGSAATGITMGYTTGHFGIRNPSLTVGSSGVTGTIFADNGNLILTTKNSTAPFIDSGDSSPKIVISRNLAGFVNIEGGDLRLGGKTLGAANVAVDLVFEGTTNNANRLILTAADPVSSFTVTLPHLTDTLVGKATSDTFTNKTYDTAGTGNVFKIAGVTLSAVTGTGNVNVLATSPAITTSLTTPSASFDLVNTTATTVSFAGAATALNMGASGGTATFGGNVIVTGDLAVNGADITTSSTGTATVFNTNATTLNMGGGAGTISIGSGSGTISINSDDIVVTGDLAVNSGYIVTNQGIANIFNGTATTVNFAGAATTLNVGVLGGTAAFKGALTVAGDLIVNGTTTTLNTTTLAVEDFNITMGLTLTSAANCTGAGIGIGVGTGITFAYDHSTSAGWLSSVNLDLATAKTYKIGGTTVLSSSALGSGVTGSSLTQVGTITSGTWSGLFGAVSGANLTVLTAGGLTGTIPAGVLGNSSIFLGTTSVALNRGTGALSLAGVNIDGNAATANSATTAATATNANNVSITTENSDEESYITFVTTNSTGYQAVKVTQQLKYNALTGELSATLIDGGSF